VTRWRYQVGFVGTVIVACTLLSGPLPAAEYVVDPTHPKASDEARGIPTEPFKTISRAARVVDPGDTVVVKPGVYREFVNLRRSGTRERPISFIADPLGSVVVTGADIITDWERTPGRAPIFRTKWPHRFVISRRKGKPVEYHPQAGPRWGRAEQVIVDGKLLLPATNLKELVAAWNEHKQAMGTGEPSRVLDPPVANLGGPFVGMFAPDTEAGWLYLWLAEGDDPKSHRVEASRRRLVFGIDRYAGQKGVSFVHVRGLVFRHGASSPQRMGVRLTGRDNLLEHCIVEEMSGGGVKVSGTMRRCVVRRCGHHGGGAVGAGFVNEECLWEANSWKPISRQWEAGGFKMTNVNGGVFRRCVFRRNGGPGLWLDIHVRNVLITECVFQGNEKSGLFIEISRNITALRNLAINNGTGVVGRITKSDWSSAGIQIAESRNCLVAFNTSVGNKDGITFREQGPRPVKTADFGKLDYRCAGNVVFGNVCAFNQGYQMGLWNDRKYDLTKQGMVIDRNLYYTTTTGPQILYGAPWHTRAIESSPAMKGSLRPPALIGAANRPTHCSSIWAGATIASDLQAQRGPIRSAG